MGISAIPNLVGFSDYRDQSIHFKLLTAGLGVDANTMGAFDDHGTEGHCMNAVHGDLLGQGY